MGCLSTQCPPGVGDACVLSWGPEEDAMVKCFVVARAREEGVRTPVSEMVVDIVRGIDAGTREPGPATIDEALRRAGVQ